ncbi:MAG: S1-like domain-containing RNA-binding protein [Verrucomicrobiales bacterium]
MPGSLLGRHHTLRVSSRHSAGLLLDAGELGEILLPRRYVPDGLEPDGEVEVFISLDSEDRPVATTECPLVMAGEFALLRVAAVTRVGVFLDWGMPKDLLLPFAEQIRRLKVGDDELVHVDVDRVSGRLVASAKLNKFVDERAPSHLHGGNSVSLLITEKTDLGIKAIVDDCCWGLLHCSDGGHVPARGVRCSGYISRVREDGLVDLSLDPPGYAKVPAAAEQLAAVLSAAEGGFLPVHDKSPPEQVREVLGISKKVFKQAAGALYKAGSIRIGEDGIYWLE